AGACPSRPGVDIVARNRHDPGGDGFKVDHRGDRGYRDVGGVDHELTAVQGPEGVSVIARSPAIRTIGPHDPDALLGPWHPARVKHERDSLVIPRERRVVARPKLGE